MSEIDRVAANRTAFERLCGAEPVLVDLGPAIEHLPGMTRETVLTSGPALPFSEYVGGQRDAIIGAVQFEGLAADREEAVVRLEEGAVRIGGCHDCGAVGSLALPVPHNCSLDFMKPLRYRGHHGDSKSGRTPPAGQSFPTSQRARRSRVARYQKPRAGGRSRL